MKFTKALVFKTIWALGVLGIASIPCAVVTVLLSLINWLAVLFSAEVPSNQGKKTILVSGGKMSKSLEICRYLKKQGHKVILVETRDYWFVAPAKSSSVDRFVLLPEHKREGERAYVDALKQIVFEEKVDVFIPVAHTIDVVVDALVKEELKDGCFVWCEGLEKSKVLDNKFSFLQTARGFGLRVPEHYIVNTPEQALQIMKTLERPDKFFMKSIASDPINRTTLRPIPKTLAGQTNYTKKYNISPQTPHLLIQFLDGQEFCTTSIIKDGRILAHTTSPSGPVQLNYKHVDIREIEEWVRNFAQKANLTGSHSFDFLMHEGKPYPIECNPRLHSAVVNFHENPEVLVDSYLSVLDEEKKEKTTISECSSFPKCKYPAAEARETFWLYNEMMYLALKAVNHPFELMHWAKHIITALTEREALFSFSDPVPFFWMHHVQMPILLIKALVNRKPYTEIDFNVGKLHWAH
ncbi:unnamed protein product [Heterosigma akashiwo]